MCCLCVEILGKPRPDCLLPGLRMCGVSRPRCGGIDPKYLVLKLTLGVFATLFWLLGLLILCIGIYAEVERQRNKTMDGFFIAPAIILLLLGLGMFTVSFVGMIGALRDNQLLLRVFKWTLVIVVVLQLIFIIVSFLCQKKVLLLFKANVREGIKHYYDDLDFKNILDRIQIKFSCCGGDDYMDWAVNQYHACDAPGPLACGAPYTCCVRNQGDVINTQCGYQTLHLERSEVDGIIHARGCVDAINLWFMDNIGITVGILAALLLPQSGSVLYTSYICHIRISASAPQHLLVLMILPLFTGAQVSFKPLVQLTSECSSQELDKSVLGFISKLHSDAHDSISLFYKGHDIPWYI
ncbi:tetraspanin-15-like isoform X2 [Stegostoma tigrinum]|uniref:tetraspanin-15-like isoform X2 n=1 Tax=Stegostoma tigrinum TaxID=3053191 RepID=UPI00202B1685|nr:tetraspanin-15-like isoform X2 [Stegostoma tigrinum]